MRRRKINPTSVVGCAVLVCFPLTASLGFAEDAKAVKRADIYDAKANGEKQIEEALKVAKSENKNVLLKFGANWCKWCHQLHAVFKDDDKVAPLLAKNYVLVLIDVDKLPSGEKHNANVDEKYGNPTKSGLPAVVVLDADGKPLATQNTEEWEVKEGYDAGKVAQFLNQWAPQKSRGENRKQG